MRLSRRYIFVTVPFKAYTKRFKRKTLPFKHTESSSGKRYHVCMFASKFRGQLTPEALKLIAEKIQYCLEYYLDGVIALKPDETLFLEITPYYVAFEYYHKVKVTPRTLKTVLTTKIENEVFKEIGENKQTLFSEPLLNRVSFADIGKIIYRLYFLQEDARLKQAVSFIASTLEYSTNQLIPVVEFLIASGIVDPDPADNTYVVNDTFLCSWFIERIHKSYKPWLEQLTASYEEAKALELENYTFNTDDLNSIGLKLESGLQ